jgi:hypothetical protein
MGLFKRNLWSHPFVKRWLIRIGLPIGYRGFNELQIEGQRLLEIYQTNALYRIIKLTLLM